MAHLHWYTTYQETAPGRWCWGPSASLRLAASPWHETQQTPPSQRLPCRVWPQCQKPCCHCNVAHSRFSAKWVSVSSVKLFFGFHEYLGTTNIKAGAFAFHAVPMNLYLFVQMDCDSKSGAPKNPFLSCKWHYFNFSLFRGPLQCWSPVAAPGHRWHRLRPIWHMAGAKTTNICRPAVPFSSWNVLGGVMDVMDVGDVGDFVFILIFAWQSML